MAFELDRAGCGWQRPEDGGREGALGDAGLDRQGQVGGKLQAVARRYDHRVHLGELVGRNFRLHLEQQGGRPGATAVQVIARRRVVGCAGGRCSRVVSGWVGGWVGGGTEGVRTPPLVAGCFEVPLKQHKFVLMILYSN
jgi:hypothetical protein